MSFWDVVKDKASEALEIIKNTPVLDAAAISILEQIPIAGPILLKMYENSKESQEEKTEHILNLLTEMKQMNDEKLEKFCTGLACNKKLILENQDYLKELSDDSSIIIEKLDQIQNDMGEILRIFKEQNADMKKQNEKHSKYTNEEFYKNLRNVLGQILTIYNTLATHINEVKRKGGDRSKTIARFKDVQEEISELRMNLYKMVNDPAIHEIGDMQIAIMGKLGSHLLDKGEDKLSKIVFKDFEHFESHVNDAREHTKDTFGLIGY